jgi:hypothetical protein
VPIAPPVAEGVAVSFLDPAAPWAGQVGADPTGTVHEAAAAATVQLVYDETKSGVSHRETYEAVIYPLDGIIDVEEVVAVDHDERDFLPEPPAGATFTLGDVAIDSKTFWSGVESDLRDHLVAHRPLQIWVNRELKIYSRVDETEEQFRERCTAAAEEAADAELARLKERLQTKIDRVREQMATAQARFQEADAVAEAKSQERFLGTAGDLLGAFLGGRSGSTALSKAARRQTDTAKAAARADSEEGKFLAKQQELVELEAEVAAAIEEVVAKHQDSAAVIEQLDIGLEKTDVRVVDVRLLWIPVA